MTGCIRCIYFIYRNIFPILGIEFPIVLSSFHPNSFAGDAPAMLATLNGWLLRGRGGGLVTSVGTIARRVGRTRRTEGSEGLKTLRKSIRVLECFSIQEPRLSLSEIARRVGLPPSTTHRIAATLREEGMLEQDGAGELYRLGLKMFELGSVVLATMELHREAVPFIEELARETGEAVHMGVFNGKEVVSIEKADSAHGLTPVITIGKGAPAYCTGWAKCSSRTNQMPWSIRYASRDSLVIRRQRSRTPPCSVRSWPRSGPWDTPSMTLSSTPTFVAWRRLSVTIPGTWWRRSASPAPPPGF